MTCKRYAAAFCVLVMAASIVPLSSASSAPRKKRYINENGEEVVVVSRPRSRVVVVPRSYLDAGTEVRPGERKFMDYADPPTYQPYNSVTNIGGRVGWHRSPLPGPFFPWGP